jgi:hypothetical protein
LAPAPIAGMAAFGPDHGSTPTMTQLDPFKFAGTDPVLDIARRQAAAGARAAQASRHYDELKAAGADATEVKAAAEIAEDLRGEETDISLEFAETTATTLPGLVAHIEAMRTDLGYGELVDRLSGSIAVAAEAITSGATITACPDLPIWERPVATLPGLRDQLQLVDAILTELDMNNQAWGNIRRREERAYYPDLPLRICRRIIAGVDALAGEPA